MEIHFDITYFYVKIRLSSVKEFNWVFSNIFGNKYHTSRIKLINDLMVWVLSSIFFAESLKLCVIYHYFPLTDNVCVEINCDQMVFEWSILSV